MSLDLVAIPCLSDNYAYLLHNSATDETALVDAPEAAPIIAELERRGWGLDTLLITHHHSDHVDAVDELRARYACMVLGAAADAHRLPALDVALCEGDSVEICAEMAEVLDVSGHTMGHIAAHFPHSKLAFTADSLMALGCGRLFEGSPQRMWESLCKLRSLPDETTICSGHEYTASNARFALSVDPDNAALRERAARIDAARAAGEPTVPSSLAEEKRTNPFLRADEPALQEAVGMPGAAAALVFAEIRSRKDNF